MYDVAIVGGGPAGLATAYYLRETGLDVIVLEAGSEPGGRTKSVDVGGLPSNTGAMFVYRDTAAEELVTELGIPTTPFTPATYGIHVNDTTVVDDDLDRLVARLPISSTARDQLRDFIHTSLEEYARYTSGGTFTADAGALAEQTMADRLIGLEDEVAAVITAAVRGGSVADPREVSAQYALRYFASYLAFEAHNRLYPFEGMQTIPLAMAERLPAGTVRLGSRVDRVTLDADGCHSVFVAGQETLRARDVVLAVPAPVALRLVDDLPQWKIDALRAARMPGSTTLCVTADVEGLPEMARWTFVATPGRLFDVMMNPHPVPEGADGEAPGRIQFVCYATSAGYRPELVDDPEATALWVQDFLQVAPELTGRILGAHLQSWENCFAILTPERARALPELQRPVGRLHFAGDHTSATAGTHGAYAEGRRVAAAVRARREIDAEAPLRR